MDKSIPSRPSISLLIIPKFKHEPPEEEDSSKEELEVAVGCDDLPVEEEDSNSSLDDEKPRDIAYICHKCRCTFYTSSEGEYYYCNTCKPRYEVPTHNKKEYSKYICNTCGIEFYSLVGNWNHCSGCSGKESIGINTDPFPSANSHLEVIYPVNKTYAKYTCRVCDSDFYSVVGDWLYCSKCISSSSGGFKRSKFSKHIQNSSLKYILYSCKMCKIPFYSCLTECYYCYECSSSNSVRKRKNKGTNTVEFFKENIKESVLKANDSAYSRYMCKECNKEFYSSSNGKWDFCGECSLKNKSLLNNLTTKPSKETNFFIRKDTIFNRYVCQICAKSFFSSSSDNICRNCKKLTKFLKREEPEEDSEASVADENDDWVNVKYEKYICKACKNPFYSKVGDYNYCSECNPVTKLQPLPTSASKDSSKAVYTKLKIPFICTHCPFKTTIKRVMRKHLLQIPRGMKRTCACSQCCNTAQPLRENDIITFKCKKCDYTTKHKKRLKSHKLAVHGAERKISLYSCCDCDFRTSYKKKLISHMTRHRQGFVYKCNQCLYATSQKGRLKKHKFKTHPPVRSFFCFKCKLEFPNKAKLKCHTEEVHLNLKTLFYCYHCSFSNPNKRRVAVHIKSIHLSPYACGLCGFFTSYKKKLDSHMLRHKVNGPQKCPLCPFETNREYLLKRHSIEKHPEPKSLKKILECEKCGYKTVQVGRMKNHEQNCKKSLIKKSKKDDSPPCSLLVTSTPVGQSPKLVKSNSAFTLTSSAEVKSNFSSEVSPERDPESESLYQCYECCFQAKARKIIRDHIVYTH